MDKYLKLPGLVDVHVHLREPGATQKEDFETGTMAAVAGGYTQVLDMPNNDPPTIDPSTINEKQKLAERRVYCDVGFNFGATKTSMKHINEVSNDIFALKLYMNKTTGPLLIEEQEERVKIFELAPKNKPLMVHALNETLEVAINLAKKYQKPIHVCHITAGQLDMVKRAKADGVAISSEVTPHHLFLDTSYLKELGPYGLMQPPLGTKHDREVLWDRIDEIDMISTDHAPHTRSEKLDTKSPRFGVPGLETTLPLMLQAVAEGRLGISRIGEMLSHNPRSIFHLPEQDDTHIKVDTSQAHKISDQNLFTKCGWTPFKGFKGRGSVKSVTLRGKKIFEDGKFLGKPQGIVLKP